MFKATHGVVGVVENGGEEADGKVPPRGKLTRNNSNLRLKER